MVNVIFSAGELANEFEKTAKKSTVIGMIAGCLTTIAAMTLWGTILNHNDEKETE